MDEHGETGIQFAPDALVAALRALRDASERARDMHAGFVSQELGVALYALVQSHGATAIDDRLGSLNYLRLLAESTLRVCWLCGDTVVADADRHPLVDGTAARERIDGLRKRDLLQLAAAYAAIHEMRGHRENLATDLLAKANAIIAPVAPPNIRRFATSPPGEAAYAAHRLCSSLVHAGLGISRIGLMSPEIVREMVNDTGYACVVFGASILRALGVDVALNWEGMLEPPPRKSYYASSAYDDEDDGPPGFTQIPWPPDDGLDEEE